MQELKVDSITDILRDRTDEVVMVVENYSGEILFVRKSFYPQGLYRLPAGGIEGKETPEEALKREFEEEFHTPVDIKKDLGILTVKLTDSKESRIYNSYIYLLSPQITLELGRDGEHSEYLWTKKTDIPKIFNKLEHADAWKSWGQFRALAVRYIYGTLIT